MPVEIRPWTDSTLVMLLHEMAFRWADGYPKTYARLLNDLFSINGIPPVEIPVSLTELQPLPSAAVRAKECDASIGNERSPSLYSRDISEEDITISYSPKREYSDLSAFQTSPCNIKQEISTISNNSPIKETRLSSIESPIAENSISISAPMVYFPNEDWTNYNTRSSKRRKISKFTKVDVPQGSTNKDDVVRKTSGNKRSHSPNIFTKDKIEPGADSTSPSPKIYSSNIANSKNRDYSSSPTVSIKEPPLQDFAQELCRVIICGRANKKLQVGNYIFNQEKQLKDTIYWKCENRACHTRVHTINGKIIKWYKRTHTHPGVPGKAKIEEILAAMKKQAITTTEPVSQIIDTFYDQIEDGCKHLAPNVKKAAIILRKLRRRHTSIYFPKWVLEGQAQSASSQNDIQLSNSVYESPPLQDSVQKAPPASDNTQLDFINSDSVQGVYPSSSSVHEVLPSLESVLRDPSPISDVKEAPSPLESVEDAQLLIGSAQEPPLPVDSVLKVPLASNSGKEAPTSDGNRATRSLRHLSRQQVGIFNPEHVPEGQPQSSSSQRDIQASNSVHESPPPSGSVQKALPASNNTQLDSIHSDSIQGASPSSSSVYEAPLTLGSVLMDSSPTSSVKEAPPPSGSVEDAHLLIGRARESPPTTDSALKASLASNSIQKAPPSDGTQEASSSSTVEETASDSIQKSPSSASVLETSPVCVQESFQPLSVSTQESCRLISAYPAKSKLQVGQYLFAFKQKYSDTIHWRCDDRTCHTIVHTVRGKIVKGPKPVHTHPSIPGKIEVEEMLAGMKECAATTTGPLDLIVKNFYAQVEDSWTNLPNAGTIKRALSRARQCCQQTSISNLKFVQVGQPPSASIQETTHSSNTVHGFCPPSSSIQEAAQYSENTQVDSIPSDIV